MARGDNVLQIIINGTNRAGPAFKQAGQQATRMGLAVTAALTAATVRAGQFEKGMAEISTLLDGDVTASIRQIRGELLDLSTEFGQSIGKMTKARYDVISAGFTDAADSAMVLEAASKLAVAGVTDVAVSADLLTSALGGFQKGAEDAEDIINVLFQTARKGKTDLRLLGQGFGKNFAQAKIAGVSLRELGAALATATASGGKTAETITGLNALMIAIAAPTEEAREALEAAGVSMKDGFLQAMIDINKAAGESPAKMRELIPSLEALNTAALIAGNIGLMTDNLKEFGEVTGLVNEGVAKMADTFDFKLNQAKRAVDALVIEIGTVFLPMAKEMADAVRLIARGLRENDGELKAAIETVGKWALGVTAAGVALTTLAQVMTIMGPLIAGMGAAFIASSVPVQVAVVAVSGLIGTLIKYRKELEEKLFPMAEKFNEETDKTPGILARMSGKLKELGAGVVGAQLESTARQMQLLALYGERVSGGTFRGPLNELWGLSAAVESAADQMQDLAEGGGEAIDTAITDGIKGAKEAVVDEATEIKNSVLDLMDEMVAEVQEKIRQMVRAQKKAGEIVFVRPPAPPEPLGPEIPEGFQTPEERVQAEVEAANAIAEARKKAAEDAELAERERIENIKAELESLAEFAEEDFIGMAFNVGNAFAMVATDIAAHLFGLTKGPLMLGRAFKQMAVSILADLAAIIARMLVARALLSVFGGGGGFFASALGSLAGNSTGGTVPTAASGYTVPGGTGNFFPPIILPGSSGLDRRPVLAAGGEGIISKPHMNAMQAAIKEPLTAPRRARGGNGGRRGMKVEVDLQANRPFNRSEQVQLTDSVEEGFQRAARYGSGS